MVQGGGALGALQRSWMLRHSAVGRIALACSFVDEVAPCRDGIAAGRAMGIANLDSVTSFLVLLGRAGVTQQFAKSTEEKE